MAKAKAKAKAKTEQNTPELSVNMAKQIFAIASVISRRADIASKLGQSFGTKRDLYEALGYKKEPSFEDFKARYKRDGLAKKIIQLPVAATWREKPDVTDSEDKDTQFEQRWQALVREKRPYHYFARVDRMCGVGEYAVLLLGFNDGKELREPVASASKLLYMQVYSQGHAGIKTWVDDKNDERYGRPLAYDLKMTTGNQKSSQTVEAHHSRVIHVAENTDENDLYGAPRLEAVLNRLQDAELVAGGSAEMFWRGAWPGYGIVGKEGAEFTEQSLTDFQEELEKFVHDLQRYMRLTNADIKQLAPAVASPRDHVDVLIDLIAAGCDIPKRILLGSERGELASSQDERAWAERIDARRKDFAEPVIIRPVIDALIKHRVLPPPEEGDYSIEWSPTIMPSEKEAAEVADYKAKALAAYVNAIGADMILPPEIFLRRVLGMSKEEITEINELIEGQREEDVDEGGE